jgi:FHS family glucose/mannose:H+ symporter-like MFS transporter
MAKNKNSNFVLFMLLSLYALALTALSPVVAEISKQLPDIDAGLIFTMTFAGFIFFALVGGRAANKIGKKKVLLFALLCLIPAFPAFAFSKIPLLSYVSVLVIGGCGGIIESLAAAFLADNNPRNPDYYVNVSHIYFGIAAIGAPLLVSWMISREINYALYYVFLSAVSAVLMFVLMGTRFEHDGKAPPESFRMSSFLKEKGFILICVALLCYTGAEVAAWGWLSSTLQFQSEFSVMQAGVAVSLFWTAMTAGRLLCGRMLKFYPAKRLLAVLGVVSAVVSFAMAFASGVFMVYCMVVLLGLGCSSMFPFLNTYGAAQSKLPTGSSYSILMVSGGLGSTFIPYLVGAVEKSDYSMYSNYIFVALFAAVVICVLAAGRLAAADKRN